MAEPSFETFLEAHPFYRDAHHKLLASNRLLATSAQLVYELHGEALGPVADDILCFVHSTYPSEYIDTYISRVKRMAELQAKFDANPCTATLGDSTVVSPEVYSLALLLSIVFTNHRFEIMQALQTFLRGLPADLSGSIASIGCGTGYELKLAAEFLPRWTIEGYDTDAEMRARAKHLIAHFNKSAKVDLRSTFRLETPQLADRRPYEAIILCELLEHLPDPARTLEALKECLSDSGKMFVTMAINIAQEDHLFLYPDVKSCRQQIRNCGLEVVQEWLSPQTVRFPPVNRENGFTRGNYIAIAGRG